MLKAEPNACLMAKAESSSAKNLFKFSCTSLKMANHNWAGVYCEKKGSFELLDPHDLC